MVGAAQSIERSRKTNLLRNHPGQEGCHERVSRKTYSVKIPAEVPHTDISTEVLATPGPSPGASLKAARRGLVERLPTDAEFSGERRLRDAVLDPAKGGRGGGAVETPNCQIDGLAFRL